MSWIQDAKGEWDKLPGGGKVAVAGIGLLTVGVAGYEWYINRNASATSASQQAGVPPDPNIPQGVGGLSALDTASLANMIAGLVNTQGKVGDTGAPGPPGPTPWSVFQLPKGNIIWHGTAGTGRLWYGTSKSNQQRFDTLFPTGTTFRFVGRNIFYTVPGQQEMKYAWQLAPHTPGGTPPPPVVNASPVLPSSTIHIAG